MNKVILLVSGKERDIQLFANILKDNNYIIDTRLENKVLDEFSSIRYDMILNDLCQNDFPLSSKMEDYLKIICNFLEGEKDVFLITDVNDKESIFLEKCFSEIFKIHITSKNDMTNNKYCKILYTNKKDFLESVLYTMRVLTK